MIYDITRPTPPEMPTLGKGLETQRLLLSQTSKDMFQPEHPLLYAPLGAKISGAEFQYPSGQWLEPCGQISLLCADSGNNKGQHSLLVEAIMHEELRSDYEEIKKFLEWQKTCKATNKGDKPVEQDLCIHVMPSDTTRPGYLKASLKPQNGWHEKLVDDLPLAIDDITFRGRRYYVSSASILRLVFLYKTSNESLVSFRGESLHLR